MRGIGIDGGRCFRQSVRLQDVDAKIVEGSGDGGIEAGSASHQITHLRAESVMHLAEHNWSGIDSYLAQCAVYSHHRAEEFLSDGAALCNLLRNALVNQIEELGNDRESGYIALG